MILALLRNKNVRRYIVAPLLLLFVMATILVSCRNPGGAVPRGAYKAALDQAVSEGYFISSKSYQKPLPAEAENAAPIYVELTKIVDNQPYKLIDGEIADALKLDRPLNAKSAEALRKTLKGQTKILALVHQAMARRECVFKRDWETKAFVDILFPELSTMRKCARLISAESRLMAYDGHGAEALKNIEGVFAIARNAGNDPIYISYLVEVALQHIALNGVIAILSDTPAAVARLGAPASEMIARAWKEPSLKQSLKYECGGILGMVEELRLGRLVDRSEDSDAHVDAAASGLKKALSDQVHNSVWMNMIVDDNGMLILKRLKAMIAASELPYPEAHRAFAQFTKETDRDRNPLHMIAGLFIPVLASAPDSRARIEAKAAIVRLAGLVLDYRSKHGDYPRSLSQLGANAIDPFDLQPLRYRLEHGGFVIYSAGIEHYDGNPDKKVAAKNVVFRYTPPARPK